jgi:hypothetical protein
MRGYGMDYNRGRSGWIGGRNRGYDTGYRSPDYVDRAWNDRGGAFQGRGEYDTYTRRDFLTNQGDFSDDFGGGDYGYEGMNRGGMARGGTRDRGSMRGYGRDYDEPRYFRHWADADTDEDYEWDSGRHGILGRGRGMDRGGGRWLGEDGFPRGYQGRGVHNYGGSGRDYFRAYGATFKNGYDPRW